MSAETSARRANRTLILQSTAQKTEKAIHVLFCGNSVATVRHSSQYVTVLCTMHLLKQDLSVGRNPASPEWPSTDLDDAIEVHETTVGEKIRSDLEV